MNYVTLFGDTVQNHNGRTALVDHDGTRHTTYQELDLLSSRVAGKLIAEGIGTGEAVIIDMGRKMEYIAAFLGILKAGGVVVPVIEEYPEERVEYIRQDCQAFRTIFLRIFKAMNRQRASFLMRKLLL